MKASNTRKAKLQRIVQFKIIWFTCFYDGNISCGVSAGLQKGFDTVDHQILLAKLNRYGICGVSNN